MTSGCARRYVGFDRPWKPAWQTVLAAAAAAAIALTSSTVEASGASQKTWRPAASDASTIARCRCVGVAMMIASMSVRFASSAW